MQQNNDITYTSLNEIGYDQCKKCIIFLAAIILCAIPKISLSSSESSIVSNFNDSQYQDIAVEKNNPTEKTIENTGTNSNSECIVVKVDTINSNENHRYYYKNNLVATKVFNLSDSLISTTGAIPDGTVKRLNKDNNIVSECNYKNGKKW